MRDESPGRLQQRDVLDDRLYLVAIIKDGSKLLLKHEVDLSLGWWQVAMPTCLLLCAFIFATRLGIAGLTFSALCCIISLNAFIERFFISFSRSLFLWKRAGKRCFVPAEAGKNWRNAACRKSFKRQRAATRTRSFS